MEKETPMDESVDEMPRYRLPASADDKIADNGHIYTLAFACNGVLFYHDGSDYDDASNTIAVQENGDLVRGAAANKMLCSYVSDYIDGSADAYIAYDFAPSVAYERAKKAEQR